MPLQIYEFPVTLKASNKRKIINDPVYGFIAIPGDLAFDIIEHPYFQRLRRIKQLGLTHLVYPGALHTRFQHALGAMHLMGLAVDTLQQKGFDITEAERQGLETAILLHDVGHGPYSHALEYSLVSGLTHEQLSLMFMESLNEELGGALDTAISIYTDRYSKKYLRKLVSSQLDVDRLDYLKRDSFFTGVSEGVISTDRIIKMLTIAEDDLAVEAKGIYSVEKFIVARRLMYWQVYLHKTVLAAEHLLIRILKRAREISQKGERLFATPALAFFLENTADADLFKQDARALGHFSCIDDYDVFTAVKVWCSHEDKILSLLCQKMVNRQLFRIILQNEPFDLAQVEALREKTVRKCSLDISDADYFVFTGEIENHAYNPATDRIQIMHKGGQIMDITESSDQLNVSVLSKSIRKFFLCYPKEIEQ
jgi:HD superfamily phosphohydrolase